MTRGKAQQESLFNCFMLHFNNLTYKCQDIACQWAIQRTLLSCKAENDLSITLPFNLQVRLKLSFLPSHLQPTREDLTDMMINFISLCLWAHEAHWWINALSTYNSCYAVFMAHFTSWLSGNFRKKFLPRILFKQRYCATKCKTKIPFLFRLICYSSLAARCALITLEL